MIVEEQQEESAQRSSQTARPAPVEDNLNCCSMALWRKTFSSEEQRSNSSCNCTSIRHVNSIHVRLLIRVLKYFWILPNKTRESFL